MPRIIDIHSAYILTYLHMLLYTHSHMRLIRALNLNVFYKHIYLTTNAKNIEKIPTINPKRQNRKNAGTKKREKSNKKERTDRRFRLIIHIYGGLCLSNLRLQR